MDKLKQDYEKRAEYFYGKYTPYVYSRLNLYIIWCWLIIRYCTFIYTNCIFVNNNNQMTMQINKLLSHLILIFIGYIIAQSQFLTAHSTLHAIFNACTFRNNVNEMWPVPYLGYLHHYQNPKILPTCWLYHRFLYTLAFGSLLSHTIGFTIAFFIIGGYNSVEFEYCLIHIMFWWKCQALGHEWYHINTETERKKHFNKLEYCFLFFLENIIGVLNTHHHRKHHQHEKGSIDIDHLEDFHVPFPISYIYQQIWYISGKILNPNQMEMFCNILHIGWLSISNSVLLLSIRYFTVVV